MTVGVVVAAAGAGTRLGGGVPKALVPVAGRPLLYWALSGLERSGAVRAVVVAAPSGAVAEVEAVALPFGKVAAVVVGGATRQASVAEGLRALPDGLSFVAVHDAARPLAGPSLLDALLARLEGGPELVGVIPGTPVADTVRTVDGEGRSTGVVDRVNLWAVQTPQLFHAEPLVAAHARAMAAGYEATDEGGLVEWAGGRVAVLPWSEANLKVTTAVDVVVAEALLGRRAASR